MKKVEPEKMNRRSDHYDPRINAWLERFFIYIIGLVAAGVFGMLAFQFQIYQNQEKIGSSITVHDKEIKVLQEQIVLVRAELKTNVMQAQLLEKISSVEQILNMTAKQREAFKALKNEIQYTTRIQ